VNPAVSIEKILPLYILDTLKLYKPSPGKSAELITHFSTPSTSFVKVAGTTSPVSARINSNLISELYGLLVSKA
jgi:hypothetical protein